jgi:hypothetical protein
VDDWIRQYEQAHAQGKEPSIRWVSDDKLTDPAARRQLEASRRAWHDQICEEVDKITRTEIVLRLLAADGGRLLAKLAEHHQVELLGFRKKVSEIKPEQLTKILELLQEIKPPRAEQVWELKPVQSAALLALSPQELNRLITKLREVKAAHKEPDWFVRPAQLDASLRDVMARKTPASKLAKRSNPPAGDLSETDLAPPLELGLKPARAGQGQLVGVVLLTDGRHNAPATSPDIPAEKLRKRHVPVFPVVLGTRYSRPSVTLADVQAPPSASSKNADVTVRVRFKVNGLRKQKVVVRLDREDKRPEQPKSPDPITIEHNGQDQYYDRSFVLAMDPEGKPLQAFRVLVQPEDRPRTGNLSQQVVIKLDDTKVKVLLADGEARWEYHYLANALGRDPSLKLRRVVFDPPLRNPSLSDDQQKKMGNPERQLPDGPDALADYQCIILGDVSPENLPLKDRQRLEQFVSKHGGTLVLVAGKRFLPLAFPRLAPPTAASQVDRKKDKDETDPLMKLLPIEDPHEVSPREGFPVTLSRDGKGSPFMQMEPDAAASEERWAAFPVHYWGIVGRAKPAATPLAYFREGTFPPTRLQANRDPDRDEEEQRRARQQALFVRQNYGRGQVLFVGLDSTWRWRYRIGDTYHHRFWGQVIRWASSDYIRFGTDKPVYPEGQDVTIDLSLEDKETRELPREGLRARVLRVGEAGDKDKQVALVPLTSIEGLRVLKGRVRNLEPGQYKVDLDRPGETLKMRLGERPPATFRVTPRDNKEMDHLECDEDLLWKLGTESGLDWEKAGKGPLANLGVRGADGKPGVRLTAVAAGSPAQRAGLVAGDRILTVNQAPVAGYDQLVRRIQGIKPGEELRLQVKRDSGTKDVTVRLDEGSRVFTPADATKVADLLPPRSTIQVKRTDRPLWYEWWTLGVFLVLVTGEWVGRKWAGLP